MFVSIKGGPYQRFRRALEIGRLPLVLAAAAELPRLDLPDALEVLFLIADQAPERPLTRLVELRLATAACELLPTRPEAVAVLRALSRG